ncbi:MAG: hypothetical protein JXA71_07170, partial [Chitinispirillaceae bacterium]|nr:hypothetical protein [Chitinispirillaceae bacterium]
VFGGLAKKWDTTFDSKRHIVINAFPGFARDSAVFTYVDYLDSNRHKAMKVAVSSDYVISITAPAFSVPCTVAVRLWAAPVKVAAGGTAIADPQYDAATKKLVIPVTANTPINLSIEAVPQRVISRSFATRALGRFSVTKSGLTTTLMVPPLAGIGIPGTANVSVFDLTGRTIVRKNVTVKTGMATPVGITTGRGACIARVEVNGVVVGKVKILAQ